MVLNNKLYDILVWVVQVILPAIGTLYFALAGIWGFPYAEQIVATITAIVTFLGTVLRISNINYKKKEEMQKKREEFEKFLNEKED